MIVSCFLSIALSTFKSRGDARARRLSIDNQELRSRPSERFTYPLSYAWKGVYYRPCTNSLSMQD